MKRNRDKLTPKQIAHAFNVPRELIGVEDLSWFTRKLDRLRVRYRDALDRLRGR